MIIKTISFDPIRVEVNGIEVPALTHSYKDEDNMSQEIIYVMAEGEKFPIKHQSEIMSKLSMASVDEVLSQVEVKRIAKLDSIKEVIK